MSEKKEGGRGERTVTKNYKKKVTTEESTETYKEPIPTPPDASDSDKKSSQISDGSDSGKKSSQKGQMPSTSPKTSKTKFIPTPPNASDSDKKSSQKSSQTTKPSTTADVKEQKPSTSNSTPVTPNTNFWDENEFSGPCLDQILRDLRGKVSGNKAEKIVKIKQHFAGRSKSEKSLTKLGEEQLRPIVKRMIKLDYESSRKFLIETIQEQANDDEDLSELYIMLLMNEKGKKDKFITKISEWTTTKP